MPTLTPDNPSHTPTHPPSPRMSQWRYLFRAMAGRNYRLFISGQLVSLLGTWMQQMAMSWLVYRLTHSTAMLGLIAFLGQGPGFFIAPVAGLLADRWNRHQLFLMTQTLAMLQAFALAWLSLSGHIQVWQLLCLSMCLGIITGVDTPIRQALVLDLLERPEDLSNAISLNSSVFNMSRLLGPALAGLIIATLGESWCFLLNGLSYIGVLAALLSMKLPPTRSEPSHIGFWPGLKEGFTYAYHVPPIRAILTLVAGISLVGLPYSVLVPVFAKQILHGGPQTMGLLMGSTGAGALSGALYLATRQNIWALRTLIPKATCGFGLALILLAHATQLPWCMALLYALGLGMMLQLASSNILLQTLADDNKRGRVMSFYAMAFIGITPLGSLLIGTMATQVGITHTLLLGGGICLLAAWLFYRQLPQFPATHPPITATNEISLSATR